MLSHRKFWLFPAIVCLVASSSGCSTPAQPLLTRLKEEPSTFCKVVCPEQQPLPPNPVAAIRQLQDWGTDCRWRQIECLSWVKQQSLAAPTPGTGR